MKTPVGHHGCGNKKCELKKLQIEKLKNKKKRTQISSKTEIDLFHSYCKHRGFVFFMERCHSCRAAVVTD